MNLKEIKARRGELEDQLQNVLQAYTRAAQAHPQAVLAAGTADSEITAERVKEMKGEDSDVGGALRRSREADEHVEKLRTESNAAATARQASEEALSDFIAEHFEVFANDAETFTARAEKALSLANRAIHIAHKAHDEAKSAWSPLCRATKISGVAPFPLATVTVVARPPSVRAEDAVNV